MHLGRVIGRLVATHKYKGLEGKRFLVCESLSHSGEPLGGYEVAVDATQAGYEVGTRNVVDVLNAQNTLNAAQRDYYNSRYDYILNLLRLKEQAGLLNPEDVYNLDSFLVVPPAPTASGSK